MKQENIPWDVISSCLSGNKEEEKLKIIRDWLAESDDHPVILREIVNTWQLTKKETAFYEPDKELLWEKLLLKIGYRPEKHILMNARIKWLAVAAVALLAFIAGVWLGNFSREDNYPLAYTSIKAPSGSRTHIVLPDSTTVWLNSGAEVRYPAAFEKKSRDVFISGECFFDVTKDLKRPFVVHCSDFKVKVFGTSFNIRENKKYERTDVSLIEGKIQVQNKSGNPLTVLSPGEQFIYKEGTGIIKKIDNMDALVAWKNDMLIFEDEPLENVVQTLESWYGVKFQVDAAVLRNHHRYTFKVKTESLREVLEFISVITPIKYTVEGEKVNIKYK
jgi:ferric-dicitrate binding protein FerR (iron transport regulator)